MKNQVIIVGGMAVIAYIAYRMFMDNQNRPTVISPMSQPNASYLKGQPSEQYPYQAPQAPRVDSSNQPWYAGDRNLASPASANLSSGMDLNFMQNVNYVKGASDIISSVSSIWDDLGVGDLFSSSDEESMSLDWSFFN